MAASADASVEARVDRSSLRLGEMFTLTLAARDRSLFEEPDLTILESDFELLGLSQGQRTTIINGQRDTRRSWQIRLAPRYAGRLEVPAVRLGAEASEPIRVTVSDVRSAAPPPSGDPQLAAARSALTFEARVDQTSPYVQEQVVLTLRVEADASLLEGSMGEPVVQAAIVERLGEDRTEWIEVDGLARQVVERRYAVFPQQSGSLEIEPVVFEGVMQTRARPSRHGGLGSFFADAFDDPWFDDIRSGSGGFFGSRGSLLEQAFGPRGQSVRVASKPLRLAVRPRPAAAEDVRWLPARSVQLVEIWDETSSEAPTFRVGEPVNRLIAVHAQGATWSQIPVPELGDVDGARQYTEPSYDERREVGGDSVAIRALPSVLIPTRPGKIDLPPIELAWWDTQADAPRTASLPGRSVEVQPAAGFDVAAVAGAVPPTAGDTGAAETQAGPEGVPRNSGGAGRSGLWEPVGLLAIAVLFGAVGGVVWVLRPAPRLASATGARPGRASAPPTLRSYERTLKQACGRNDPAAAELALSGIARARWPGEAVDSPSRLGRRLCDEALEREIRLLLSRRYAAQAGDWQGEALWQQYRRVRREAGKVSGMAPTEVLPGLYPGLRGAG